MYKEMAFDFTGNAPAAMMDMPEEDIPPMPEVVPEAEIAPDAAGAESAEENAAPDRDPNLGLKPGMHVVITASVSRRDESEAPRVVASKVELLDDAVRLGTTELIIDLFEDEVNDKKMEQLQKLLNSHT